MLENISAQRLDMARRIAVALGVICVALLFVLMFMNVKENGVDCGNISTPRKWDYILKGEPVPQELWNCDYAIKQRERKLNLLLAGAGIGFGAAVAVFVVQRRQRHHATVEAAARRRPKPGSYNVGDRVQIVLASDRHHHRIGHIAELLNSNDAYDVTVSFGAGDSEDYAYKFSEIRPAPPASRSVEPNR
ncbi:MAG: hypothetical protein WBB05_25055 [Mycolicibacterium fortuitum]